MHTNDLLKFPPRIGRPQPSFRATSATVNNDALQAVAAVSGDLLLRAPQVCSVIGVSMATLYRMLDAGERVPTPYLPLSGHKSLAHVRRASVD